METLKCESCSKNWKRKPSRGRKPRLCPSCIVAPTVPSKKAVAAPKPIAKPIPTVAKPRRTERVIYKFPAPTKWVCPSCQAKVGIGVDIDYPPTHSCQKRLKRVLPLDLIRSQA